MKNKKFVSKIVLKDNTIIWVYTSSIRLSTLDIVIEKGNSEEVYKFKSFRKGVEFLKEIIKEKDNVISEITDLWVGRALWTWKRFYEYVLDY
jgi:hypothetical protein